ncbi:MAG: hypothetical protein GX569_01135 [Candidatus Riflebacteria bacterium]|nr:hypothetical protein [Candidatus Riflebacteria bacterium]
MDILATIWQIIWILLLLTVATGSVILLAALFHPLRFDLKLRGSVKGQRAEVWLVYLFRTLRIGIIATPHTQDVVISFLGWKKRLERMTRRKPVAPPHDSPPSAPPAAAGDVASKTSSEEPTDNLAAEAVSKPVEPPDFSAADSANADQAQPEPEKAVEAEPTREPAAPVTISEAATDAARPETKESAPAAIDEAETIEPVAVAGQPDAPVDTRPLKPLNEVEEEYRAAKSAETVTPEPQSGAGKQGASLKQLLRKFKRDASRRFSQVKGYLRLFRRKWRALSPVFKRFWQRGKKGFGLPRLDLLLRYALHEPYLTGMSHATLAVASGMAGQWGINFVPVPHFGAPMLYSKAWVTGVIRPWRLVFATGALLFEKQLYIELWQLFKWYRAKKQH